MRLWDNHMHCAFSGDSNTPPEVMIAAAKEKQLAGITFTDHLDWDYKEDPGLFDLDLATYQQQIRQLSQVFSEGSFTILCGLELGLQPNLVPKHQQLFNDYSFDYVIGSTHVVNGRDPYYPSFFDHRTSRQAYTEYYEAVYANLMAFDGFDALGHLDYIFRYGPHNNDPQDTYHGYSEIIDAILQAIIRKDIALEVNTGAFRCHMQEPNPGSIILKRYRELGGQLITIGADAHKPVHVGLGYDLLPNILRDCGFTEYVVYKNRIPYPHLIAI